MEYYYYEKHSHEDPDFPIIFNKFIITKQSSAFSGCLHWHESIEIIYIAKGTCKIICGLNTIIASDGDIVIINSNEIHNVSSVSSEVEFYYLIVDDNVYNNLIPNIENVDFIDLIKKDEKAQSILNVIIGEMRKKDYAYKAIVKSNITILITYFARNYVRITLSKLDKSRKNNKIKLIKDSLNFFKSNYGNNISINELCVHIGCSKYYFCRTFKEITKMTPIDYLNMFRCQKAQILLSSGSYNVTQVSALVGYNNITYFCRVYKRYMNRSPSMEKQCHMFN